MIVPIRFRAIPILVACLVALAPRAARAQGGNGADNSRRVDALFSAWDRSESPGCALGVYRDGAIAYSRGYGMADLERRVPITPRTIFDIGSTSKQFTAAAIVMLAQDGKLTLDDDVRKWVPELPDYGRPITIRHMLLHTSGIRDYIGLLTLAGARIDDVTDAADALRIIARQKALNFEPGAERLYSNSGYFLLSVIVERAAKQTLQAFAREKIFKPLGMNSTHYLASYDDIVPDRALAYAPRGGGLRLDLPRWLQVGDGAVFTNVEELLQWDRNFYEPRVGGAKMLETLQQPGTLGDGRPLTYALGLVTGTYRGQRTISHGGSWGGYRAELLRFPSQRFSVAILCNLGSIDPSLLARRVADVYLDKVLSPENASSPAASSNTSPVAPDLLQSYAGMYRNPATRERLVFAVASGTLAVSGVRLQPRSDTIFGVDGAPATFTFEPAGTGRPARVRREQEGRDTEILEKVQPLKLNAEDLAPLAGRYYSEELDATWSLAVEDGALVIHRRGAPPQRPMPVVADEFMAGGLTLRFVRADGRVTGMVLDLGRVRDLRFERR